MNYMTYGHIRVIGLSHDHILYRYDYTHFLMTGTIRVRTEQKCGEPSQCAQSVLYSVQLPASSTRNQTMTLLLERLSGELSHTAARPIGLSFEPSRQVRGFLLHLVSGFYDRQPKNNGWLLFISITMTPATMGVVLKF